MIKRLFLLFIILISFSHAGKVNIEEKLSTQECGNINGFSLEQVQYIIKSYIWGLPYGLEEILPAIAWQESCLGLYKVNMYDPSAGLYHAYLPSVMARHPELKNDKFTKNKVAQMLINDDEFAVSEAISEILFWKNYYKQNKKTFNKYNIIDFILMSYNRGTRWQKKRRDRNSALRYSKSVKNKMKKIEKFIQKFDLKKEIDKIYN